MGLPVQETPHASNSTSTETLPVPSTETQPSSNLPKSVADLPPAALELASRLFDLARTGQAESLQQYLGAGIPPNLTNHAGDTLLMLAAYHGHAATVRMLLDIGANKDAVNDRGQSPLAGAVFKGWDEVVQVLAEKGANWDHGHPTARDCVMMFKRESYVELMSTGTNTEN